MAPDVEVLIVSYASADQVAQALASLRHHAPGVGVAIREHSDDPAALEQLRACAAGHPAPVRITADPTNPGFGAGCNALAAESAAAWLVFLNPDAELVEWPWNSDAPPRRTIVGATIVESGAGGRHAGRRYRIVDEMARSWLRRRPQPQHGKGFVSGAAMLIDAESFRQLGGFDARYFLFYEDIDLCLRANEAGIATEINERWRVRHAGAHSTSPQFANALKWSYESGARFHADRGEPRWCYRLYVLTDSVARAVLATLTRRPARRGAYMRLAGVAARDLLGRRPEQ